MDAALKKKRKTEDNNGTAPDGVTTLLTPTDLRQIIEPFTKDQLLDILQHAASLHLDVLESVRSIADRDPSQRKLFIRGLHVDTTTQGLRNLFSAYGELEEAVVVLDKDTKKSKGYGFINFKHIDGALLALKEPSKIIDGRMTLTQLASAGFTPNPDVAARKIYVGNVPSEMPAERLLGHFLSYGEIEEGPLGYDKVTGKARGFALFVYKNNEAARAALVDPIKIIDGVQLSCKLALDGKKPGYGGVQPHTSLTNSNAAQYDDGAGVQPPTSLPNSNVPHYAPPSAGGGGGGGGGSYGAYASAHQGPAGLSHPASSQVPPLGGGGGYGDGFSHHYNGLGGGPPPAYASSMYRLPPGSVGYPSSGYPEGGHYGLSSPAFPGQIPQQLGSSPVPRMPPGGFHPSMPHHY